MNILYQKMFFFMFDAQQGSTSALFAAIDADILNYCGKLKAEEWPVCAFIGCHCRTTKPSKEAYNVRTSHQVWEKTLEMIDLLWMLLTWFFKVKKFIVAMGLKEMFKPQLYKKDLFYPIKLYNFLTKRIQLNSFYSLALSRVVCPALDMILSKKHIEDLPLV